MKWIFGLFWLVSALGQSNPIGAPTPNLSLVYDPNAAPSIMNKYALFVHNSGAHDSGELVVSVLEGAEATNLVIRNWQRDSITIPRPGTNETIAVARVRSVVETNISYPKEEVMTLLGGGGIRLNRKHWFTGGTCQCIDCTDPAQEEVETVWSVRRAELFGKTIELDRNHLSTTNRWYRRSQEKVYLK